MLKEIVIVDAGHLNIIFVASITIKSVCGSRRSILESVCPIHIPHPPLHILRNRWVGREPRGNLRRWMHFAFWEDEAISALASDVSCLPIFGDISLGRNLTRQFSFFPGQVGSDMRHVQSDCATFFGSDHGGLTNLIFNFGPKHLRLSFHAVCQSNTKDLYIPYHILHSQAVIFSLHEQIFSICTSDSRRLKKAAAFEYAICNLTWLWRWKEGGQNRAILLPVVS